MTIRNRENDARTLAACVPTTNEKKGYFIISQNNWLSTNNNELIIFVILLTVWRCIDLVWRTELNLDRIPWWLVGLVTYEVSAALELYDVPFLN